MGFAIWTLAGLQVMQHGGCATWQECLAQGRLSGMNVMREHAAMQSWMPVRIPPEAAIPTFAPLLLSRLAQLLVENERGLFLAIRWQFGHPTLLPAKKD